MRVVFYKGTDALMIYEHKDKTYTELHVTKTKKGYQFYNYTLSPTTQEPKFRKRMDLLFKEWKEHMMK